MEPNFSTVSPQLIEQARELLLVAFKTEPYLASMVPFVVGLKV